MSQLFPTMTPDIMAQLIRAARRRRFERRGAWRCALTNFRPANPAKAQDISANLTCANAAPKESQGV